MWNPENPLHFYLTMSGLQHQDDVCKDVLSRLIPHVLDTLTQHIDHHFDTMGQKQLINLNVRAPKRLAHQHMRTTAHIGNVRPLPVARFLDEMEKKDTTWCGIRRSLAPTFGMQVMVLKKRKLKQDGATAIYVVQNHRPQMLYTEEDRLVMEEAWDLTQAHREDLVCATMPDRIALRVPENRPSVLDLLTRRVL